ncbi:MAG: MFS transporter [Chloroflexi bacterium]|nr:MFS transporter [Chloroflexota bacterium]
MPQDPPQVTAGPEEYSRYRWIMVGLLLLAQEAVVLIPLGMMLPSMRAELKFGIAQSGLLGTMAQLAGVLFTIPSSLLLMRFRPKWVYLISLILTAVFGFIIGQAMIFIALLLPYLLMGATNVIRQVPDTLLRVQWVPRRELGRVMAITMAMSALGQSVGIMVIPFLLIFLRGWRNLFSLFGLAMFVLAVIWFVFARERVTSAYKDGMASQNSLISLKTVLKRKEIIMAAFANLGIPTAYATTSLFLPTYLVEERGMPLTTIGFIVSMMPIGGVFGNLTAGFLSDKIGLRKPLIWPAGFIIPFFYFGITLPIPTWLLLISTFFIGFLAWAPLVALRSIPFELKGIKPSEVAVGQSVIQTVTMLGIIVVTPLVGSIADISGSIGTALRIVCVFPLLVGIMGLIIPETGPKAVLRKA